MHLCQKCLNQIETKPCKICKRRENSIYYKENSAKIALNCARWRKANPVKNMALTAKYYKENPEKKAALSARRHASKLQRTPKWLTPADWIEMKWAYQIAHDLTVLTGIPHQVDHILPLQGKNVSGLHCPQNLQIITQAENCRKGNKF